MTMVSCCDLGVFVVIMVGGVPMDSLHNNIKMHIK